MLLLAGPSSVMIIHRPGCEILDELVHELRAILMSYGITVKGTLVDQNILDAEGGIASYLQRNIKDCDHVLVLLTQKGNFPANVSIMLYYKNY